jgi:hypothetical protein
MNARKLFFGAWIFLLVVWMFYLCVGAHLAQALTARLNGKIIHATQGKVADIAVPIFIQNRMKEALWLATLALLLVMMHWLFENWRRRKNIWKRSRWAIHGVVGFIFLNMWVGAAANTVLYWGFLGAGAGYESLMQFQLKRNLMNEYPGPQQAVLMGNSQTRSQIDEGQLNDLMGNRLWTTELHWPGSQGFDLLMVERQIREANPKIVICYLTGEYFYMGATGVSLPPFFSFREMPDLIRRGAFDQLPGNKFFYGILGDVMPVFRSRDILAQRFLGDVTVNLKQTTYDNSLKVDLEERAKEVVNSYKNDRATVFQKQAFEDFISRCEKAHRRVILFAGQSNPILESKLSPAFRADMTAFLEQIKSRHNNVILVSAAEMPVEVAADYQDLSHITPGPQKRFTAWLAGWLEKQLDSKSTPAKK